MRRGLQLLLMIGLVIVGFTSPVHASSSPQLGRDTPIITWDNIDRLSEIAVLGRGTPLVLDGLPNNPYFRVLTRHGIYVYDTNPTPHFYGSVDELPVRYRLPVYPTPSYTVSIGGNPTIRYKQGTTRLLARPIVASQDLRLILFAPDQRLAVWNIARGGLEGRILEGNQDQIVAANFSPDATQVIAASADGIIHLWDVATGRHRFSFAAPDAWVNMIGLVAQNSQVVALDQRGQVWKWDVTTGQGSVIDQGYTTGILDVAFSPDGATIAVNGGYGVYLWKFPSGDFRSLRLLNTGGKAGLRFSSDGKLLFTQSTTGLRAWEIASGKLRQRWRVGDDFFGLTKTINQKPSQEVLIVSGVGISSWDQGSRTLSLIDPYTGQTTGTLKTDFKVINGAAVSPDGSTLAVVGGNSGGYTGMEDRVQLYDLRDLQPMGDPISTGLKKPHLVWYLADGRLLVAIGSLKAVFVSPNREVRPAFESACAGYNEGVNTVQSTQSPDTHLLVFQGVGECMHPQVYQIDGGVKPLKVNVPESQAFAFSPDGRLFAVGDARGLIHIFQVAR